MAELAVAYISLIPSLKGAQKQIEKELGGVDTDGAGKKVGGGFSSSIGKVLKVGAVATGAAVAGVLGTALTKGFGRLKAIENAQAKLRGLGHDAGTVEEIMDNALASVKGTAFGLDEAATTAAGAVAAGIKPGKELEGVLKGVANVSSATGRTMEETGAIFNNVSANQAAYTEDIKQIARAGLPIWEKLQEVTGKTQAEVRKMATEGKIDFEMFAEASALAAGTVADEMGNTTTGAFNNMMAALGRLGAKILDDIFPLIGPLFKDITSWLDTATTSVEPLVDAFGEKLKNAIESVKTSWAWVKNNSDWIAPIAVAVGAAVAAFALWKGAIALWNGVTKVATGIQAAFNLVMAANPVMLVVMAIAALVAGLVYFFTQTELGQEIWAKFTTFLTEAWTNITTFLSETWENITQWFTDFGNTLSEAWTILWEGVGNFLSETWANIKQFFADALQFVVDLFMNWTVYGLIIKHWDEIKQFFIDVWDGIKKTVSTAIDNVSKTVETITNAIKNTWDRVWGGIKRFFTEVWDGIKETVSTAIENVSKTIETITNAIKNTWDTVWGGIKRFFTDIWDDIVSAATRFTKSVKDKFTEVTDFVKEVPAKVLEKFANIGTTLIDSGRSLIQGFLDGIMEKFDWAKTKVSEGLGAIRDLFPFSPAKEGPFSGRGWVDRAGVSLGQTFTESIADSLSDGRKGIHDEMGGIEDEFDRLEAYANGTEFSVRAAVPTTEPVLADLSGSAPLRMAFYDADGIFQGYIGGQIASGLRGGSRNSVARDFGLSRS